jgi:hypothetical protein
MHDRVQRETSDPLDVPDFTVVEKWFKARLTRGNAKGGKDGLSGANDWMTVLTDERNGALVVGQAGKKLWFRSGELGGE